MRKIRHVCRLVGQDIAHQLSHYRVLITVTHSSMVYYCRPPNRYNMSRVWPNSESFTNCLVMFYIHTDSLWVDCVCFSEQIPTPIIGVWRLRTCILPRTRTKFAERDFYFIAAAARNSLPSDLLSFTDTGMSENCYSMVGFMADSCMALLDFSV